MINLKEHLDKQTYDKNYQDIDCLGLKGYSESHKSWENMKNLVDWKDKKVADLGCFHGYFSFKIAKLGAKVTGLEKSKEVLVTTQLINEAEGGIIELKQWEGGDIVPEEFDLVLCLNVLHHFKNQELGLQNIKASQGLFEVNKEQKELIFKYFNIIKEVSSHRINRTILLADRKK